MSFIVCCQAVRQKQDVVFCKEFLKKSAWEKLSFFPKVLFFSALFFQILSVYDIAQRIKRFAPIKRHDMLPVNIVSSDTEETALALNGKKTKLRKKDFLALAASCGLAPAAAEKMIRRLIGKIDTMISIAQNAEIPDDIRMGCIELIKQRVAVFDYQ